MQKFVFLSIVLIIISGCSYRVVRTGYDLKKTDYRNCKIAIKKDMQSFESLEKIGEIKLGESGFSSNCNEAEAMQILKGEGCAINANVVNITEEKRPDVVSSCYRCRAEFYKYTVPGISLESDEEYKIDNVSNRVSKDHRRNIGMAIGAVVVGIILGSLIF